MIGGLFKRMIEYPSCVSRDINESQVVVELRCLMSERYDGHAFQRVMSELVIRRSISYGEKVGKYLF